VARLSSTTVPQLIYLRQSAASSRTRSPSARVRVKILLHTIGSRTIGNGILKILESGGCQLAWYNPIHWYSIGRFNNRTHAPDKQHPFVRPPAAPQHRDRRS